MAGVKEDPKEVKSQIIMRVDAPPEESDSTAGQGDSVNSAGHGDAARSPNCAAGKPRASVLAPPRLNSNSAAGGGGGGGAARSILRPSQLDLKPESDKCTEAGQRSQFSLNPSRLNVFARADRADREDREDAEADGRKGGDGGPDAHTDTPKFVPLAVTEASRGPVSAAAAPTVAAAPAAATATAASSNFVFGRNLHERVASEPDGGAAPAPAAAASCSDTNGTSEFLFRVAARSVSADAARQVKSLTESAREYEESRANKRKYEQVAVVTGEEDEKNVLQINCKLFAFDKSTGNWQERGRGLLRLNDREAGARTHSRLVVRTAGSLRVVLNTKIWAEMTVDRASLKSVRLTAMDASGQVRVFLVMASADEAAQLHRLLEARVLHAAQPSPKRPAVQPCQGP